MWCRLITGGDSTGAKAISWLRENTLPEAPGGRPPDSLYTETVGDEYSTKSQESERRIAEAFQRGLREGEAAANQKLNSQVATKVAQLAQSIEQLAAHRSNIHRQAEPELVKLSLAIARRILRRELTVDPDSLLGIVRVSLQKIESCEVQRVRVHPEYAATLTKLLEGSAHPITVVSDPGLPVGSVVFDTARGSLDAGIETQLKEIDRGFADIYRR